MEVKVEMIPFKHEGIVYLFPELTGNTRDIVVESLKACDKITKKKESVIWRTDNLLYDGREVFSIVADYNNSLLQIHTAKIKYEDVPVCPKCHHRYYDHPAISRIDSSNICSACGQMEAIEAFTGWEGKE